MKIIRRYIAIQICDNATLNFPSSYKEFETEDEAIEYAYKTDKWGEWLILPVIKFDNI